MRLLCVFDAYCGWSYGFASTLEGLVAHGFPVGVISGGLFVGDQRRSVREFDHLEDTNTTISQVTGARFGAEYERLVADGDFIMDSVAAARGFAALRGAGPGMHATLAVAQMRAFFREGQSLSDPRTYRAIARDHGLNGDAVAAAYGSFASTDAALRDFHRAAELGVESFPTLLAVVGGRARPVAVGAASFAEVQACLRQITLAMSRSTPLAR